MKTYLFNNFPYEEFESSFNKVFERKIGEKTLKNYLIFFQDLIIRSWDESSKKNFSINSSNIQKILQTSYKPIIQLFLDKGYMEEVEFKKDKSNKGRRPKGYVLLNNDYKVEEIENKDIEKYRSKYWGNSIDKEIKKEKTPTEKEITDNRSVDDKGIDRKIQQSESEAEKEPIQEKKELVAPATPEHKTSVNFTKQEPEKVSNEEEKSIPFKVRHTTNGEELSKDLIISVRNFDAVLLNLTLMRQGNIPEVYWGEIGHRCWGIKANGDFKEKTNLLPTSEQIRKELHRLIPQIANIDNMYGDMYRYIYDTSTGEGFENKMRVYFNDDAQPLFDDFYGCMSSIGEVIREQAADHNFYFKGFSNAYPYVSKTLYKYIGKLPEAAKRKKVQIMNELSELINENGWKSYAENGKVRISKERFNFNQDEYDDTQEINKLYLYVMNKHGLCPDIDICFAPLENNPILQ